MEKVRYAIADIDETEEGSSTKSFKKFEKCQILKSYWYNGEGWYRLKKADGTVFESPDIFWTEIDK